MIKECKVNTAWPIARIGTMHTFIDLSSSSHAKIYHQKSRGSVKLGRPYSFDKREMQGTGKRCDWVKIIVELTKKSWDSSVKFAVNLLISLSG